ncbi:MAG: hypothetical protein IPJ65_13305 [Archangiaceae bacterium]|nr:hypothetical protein [Archangiaceae bacterium]
MSDLEPISDALKEQLDAAEWPAPPADLADRLLPGLHAAWGAHAAASAAAAGAAPVGSPVSVVKRLFGSAGALSTAGALVVGAAGGVALHQEMAPAPAPQIIVVQVPVPAPAPVEPSPPVEPRSEPVEPSPPAPRPKPALKAAVSPSSMAAEQRLLDGARTAVLRGEPQLALPLLEQYRKEHPRGALVEEHAALEVQALALAGRTDQARAAAERFRARFPGSFFTEAVDLAISEMKARPTP